MSHPEINLEGVIKRLLQTTLAIVCLKCNWSEKTLRRKLRKNRSTLTSKIDLENYLFSGDSRKKRELQLRLLTGKRSNVFVLCIIDFLHFFCLFSKDPDTLKRFTMVRSPQLKKLIFCNFTLLNSFRMLQNYLSMFANSKLFF